jgi:hypothetical protein
MAFFRAMKLRELFLKVVGTCDLLTFRRLMTFYTPELDNARVLAATVRQLDAEVKTYAADRALPNRKEGGRLDRTDSAMPAEWQRYPKRRE